MKKYWVQIVGTAGAVTAIVSVLWEYVRMRPDYGFVVEPWSLRGYEIVHGWVTLSIGVAALVAFWLVVLVATRGVVPSAIITGVMVVEAVVIAAVFGNEDYSVTPGFMLIAVLAAVVALIVYRLLRSMLPGVFRSFLVRALIGLLLLAGIFLGLNATLGGSTVSFAPWLGILAIVVVMAALSLSATPRELAANRMLMYSSLAGAVAITVSAGAVRSTLVREQLELDGIAAEYIDTQVTWGHLMGVIGLTLMLFAAVALWARRRDQLLNATRARRQREAAEASAAEIAAAQERLKQASLNAGT